MDRELTYTGQLLPASALLQTAKDPLIGLAKLAAGVLGTSTQINGFACTPTGPASMQVNIAAGEIYALAQVDATAYGDLGTDTRTALKQGILLDPVLLTFTAPATAGQSIAYLVQVTLQDQDTNAAVLPYYNSSNPSSPFLGPNNTGAAQATRRRTLAVVSIKAGSAATTGSQVAPAPDAGNVGAWVVTVANGQTTITAPNIAQYAEAPFIKGLGSLQFLGNSTGVNINSADGIARFLFNANNATDHLGAGAVPHRFFNGVGAQIGALASSGVLSTGADAVSSGDVPRFGQLNSRPGHTYAADDWFWLDKSAGLILQYGNIGAYSGTPVAVTFPTTFSQCFNVMALGYLGPTSITPTQDATVAFGKSASGVSFRTFSGSSPAGFYIAIGAV